MKQLAHTDITLIVSQKYIDRLKSKRISNVLSRNEFPLKKYYFLKKRNVFLVGHQKSFKPFIISKT